MTGDEATRYPHVRVKGSARERGRQYGRLARERIRKSLASYESLFEYYSHIDWAEARQRARQYVPAIEAYGPHYLEEMVGLAEGAGLEFEDILALNVRSELRFAGQVEELAGQQGSRQRSESGECTCIVALPGVTADGHTLLAQNWDWKVHARDTTIILEVEQHDAPNYVTVVEAGLLAKAGMNDCGLGIVTNTLVSDLDRGEPSVPYHVVLRSLFDARSISQAFSRLLSATRASSANYLLASEDGLAVNAECLPGGAACVRADSPQNGFYAHANHFTHRLQPVRDLGIVLIPDSLFRLQRLTGLVRGRDQSISVPLLESALGDHANHPDGICAHEHDDEEELVRSATIASLIMDLKARKLWLAEGNPCQVAYRELDYSPILAG